MNLATAVAGTLLTAFGQFLNRGSLVIYSGTQPTTPETALSGNSALGTWTFTATAAGSASFSGGLEQESDTFVAASVNPTTGTASFGRGSVWAWTASTASIAVGDYCVNGSNLYQATVGGTTAGSGGPTGTTTATDNTVTWKYISAANNGTGHVFGDYTVGTSATDIIVGSTSFTNGVNVTLTLAHKLGAS